MMTDDNERFLDLACLTYSGADDPQRRTEAEALLAADPSLPESNIHVAAALGAVDHVRQLVELDASAATRPGGPRSWEPLLYLAYSRVSTTTVTTNYIESAKILLDNGANANASFSLWGSEFTVLTGVLGEGERGPENQPEHPSADQLSELLLANGASANDPQGAYNRMHREQDGWLRMLLAQGLRADHQINWDMDGHRPRTLDFLLSHAVDAGYSARVRLLLDHGADPSTRNPYNGRPIRTNALLRGATDLVEMLEAAGASVVPLTAHEQFRLALHNRDLVEAQRLVAGDASCLDDVTLLRDAAQVGDLDVAEMLLELGAAVNATDAGGVTPLHKAAENGHLAMISRLLSYGADPTIEDLQFNATPLGWAEHLGQPEAAQMLRDHLTD